MALARLKAPVKTGTVKSGMWHKHFFENKEKSTSLLLTIVTGERSIWAFPIVFEQSLVSSQFRNARRQSFGRASAV